MKKKIEGLCLPSLGNGALRLEFILLDGGLDGKVTIVDGDFRTAVEELGGDVLVRVKRVFGLDGDRMRATDCGWVDWENRFELGFGGVVPRGVRNGCHSIDRLLDQGFGSKIRN